MILRTVLDVPEELKFLTVECDKTWFDYEGKHSSIVSGLARLSQLVSCDIGGRVITNKTAVSDRSHQDPIAVDQSKRCTL
jgi:hypothetical protein